MFEWGGFPSNSRHRDHMRPVCVSTDRQTDAAGGCTDEHADGQLDPEPPKGKHREMCWAQRLKRVFIGAAQVGPPRFVFRFIEGTAGSSFGVIVERPN